MRDTGCGIRDTENWMSGEPDGKRVCFRQPKTEWSKNPNSPKTSPLIPFSLA